MASSTSHRGIVPKQFTRSDDINLIRLRAEYRNNLNAWTIISQAFQCENAEVKWRYKRLFKSDDQYIKDAFIKYPCPDQRITNHKWTVAESNRIAELKRNGESIKKIAEIINAEFSINVNHRAVEGRLRTMKDQWFQKGRCAENENRIEPISRDELADDPQKLLLGQEKTSPVQRASSQSDSLVVLEDNFPIIPQSPPDNSRRVLNEAYENVERFMSQFLSE